jgi:hypothetical protein
MTSNGRTTDILQVLAGEDLELMVVDQVVEQVDLDNGMLTPCIMRESYIINKDSKFILSHNFAKIYPDFTPKGLNTKIVKKEEGIGSSIKDMDIISTRRLLDYGWKDRKSIVDLHRKPQQLIFTCNSNVVPFKEYEVSFEQNGHPGIHLIEYFNPHLLNNIKISSGESVEMFVK